MIRLVTHNDAKSLAELLHEIEDLGQIASESFEARVEACRVRSAHHRKG
jgi:hypothetical protein